jgi:hypothetical protein
MMLVGVLFRTDFLLFNAEDNKVKLSQLQAVETCGVMSCRGSHIL